LAGLSVEWTCRHCSALGHTIKYCPGIPEGWTQETFQSECIDCTQWNRSNAGIVARKTDHATGSRACNTYRKLRQSYFRKRREVATPEERIDSVSYEVEESDLD